MSVPSNYRNVNKRMANQLTAIDNTSTWGMESQGGYPTTKTTASQVAALPALEPHQPDKALGAYHCITHLGISISSIHVNRYILPGI